MEIENITQILILTHVGFGGIALISGAISMIAKKGNWYHKKSGKVFYYALLTSALISLVVSLIPNHQSPFFFCLGLFSLYFIIGGYRSLTFKIKNASLWLDKIIACLIILVGLTMMIYPILLNGKINIVLFYFGAVSIVFGVIDLLLFQNSNKTKRNWLNIHLTKMIGAYLVAATAFVVNQSFLGIWSWFLPTIIGNIYLFYWLIKLNRKKTADNNV
ncbi:DUF2306 domain-containing protein [Tenacibaculum amylolyticum]|uniref:DUF2306 domain-containing protein n=1 Tax=Tenacibaculum amylolyticum TaxID=104269 RepID=UPI003892F3E4